MEYQIERLTQLTAEIEGLLYVLQKRDNYAIRENLASKYAEFKSLMDSVVAENFDDDDVCSEPAVIEPLSDTESLVEVESFDEVKENLIEEADVVSEPEVDNEPESTALEVEVEPVIVQSETEPEVAIEPLEALEPEEPAAEVAAEEEKQEEAEPVRISATINDILSGRPGELRVDEMLSRREARNLRKAFTLNDKFRYRRELFGNNDELFGETLDAIQGMESYDQAVDYLVNELGWELNNEDVEDFLATVKNHFNAI